MINPAGASLSRRLTAAAEAAGLSLDPVDAERISGYLGLLAKWNQRINLTALPLDGFPPTTLSRLVIEPLQGAARLGRIDGLWLDLGSGGGSPAIPMAIVSGNPELVMVESRGRKAAFLREAVQACGLSRARVISERIETLSASAFRDVRLVTARAIRVDRCIAEVVRDLVAPTARILLFGPTDWAELADFAEVEWSSGTEMTLLRVPRGTHLVI